MSPQFGMPDPFPSTLHVVFTRIQIVEGGTIKRKQRHPEVNDWGYRIEKVAGLASRNMAPEPCLGPKSTPVFQLPPPFLHPNTPSALGSPSPTNAIPEHFLCGWMTIHTPAWQEHPYTGMRLPSSWRNPLAFVRSWLNL